MCKLEIVLGSFVSGGSLGRRPPRRADVSHGKSDGLGVAETYLHLVSPNDAGARRGVNACSPRSNESRRRAVLTSRERRSPARESDDGNGQLGDGKRTRAGRRSRGQRPGQGEPRCGSERPAVVGEDWPGQVEAAAVAAVVGQLRRSFVERAGACYLLRLQDVGRAKGVSRSAGLPVWQGYPGCRVVSVQHLLDAVVVDQGVIAPVGIGFRLGRRERNPPTPQPGLGTTRR